MTLVTGIGGDRQAGRLGIMTVACGDDGGSDEHQQEEEEEEKAMMKFMSLTL